MTTAALLALAQAKPFRSFWLRLADGRTLEVDGPECWGVSPDGRILTLYLPNDDESEVVDLSLVVSLRFSEGDAVPSDFPA